MKNPKDSILHAFNDLAGWNVQLEEICVSDYFGLNDFYNKEFEFYIADNNGDRFVIAACKYDKRLSDIIRFKEHFERMAGYKLVIGINETSERKRRRLRRERINFVERNYLFAPYLGIINFNEQDYAA